MQINSSAVLKTSKKIQIEAPLSKVWDIHTDINAWRTWHPQISHSLLKGVLTRGSIFEWKSDGYKLKSTITAVEKNNLLAWKGVGFGASAIHVWEFTKMDNGDTLVRTDESMDGWLVTIFKGMMEKKLDDSLNNWLAALKHRAESL